MAFNVGRMEGLMDMIEEIAIDQARLEGFRNLYRRLKDDSRLQDHPNYDLVLQIIAKMGEQQGHEIRQKVNELFDIAHLE